MTLDNEHMKRVAEAATPGPWTVSFDSYASCGGEWDVYEIPSGAYAKFERREDAEFIATFNPATVLALIDSAEAAEARALKAEEALKCERYAREDGLAREDEWAVAYDRLNFLLVRAMEVMEPFALAYREGGQTNSIRRLGELVVAEHFRRAFFLYAEMKTEVAKRPEPHPQGQEPDT